MNNPNNSSEKPKYETMIRVSSGREIKVPANFRIHLGGPFEETGFRRKIFNSLTEDEISFCIFTFLSEGNNLEKILDGRLPPERHSKLEAIVSKANIQSKIERSRQTATLARIATVFPEIAAMTLSASPNLPGSVSLKKIVALTGVADYPNLGREPYLASILPKTNRDSEHMLNVFMLASMMQSEKINKKFKDMSSRNKWVHTEHFQLRFYKFSLFNEEERKRWCEKLDITKDNSFTPAWKAAADAAKIKLLEVYESCF